MSKYRLVHAEKANFPIVMMCRLLGIGRSAYYAWVDRPASARAVQAEVLATRIMALHAGSDGVYGSPRLLAELRAEGVVVSGKTVAKAMRLKGIRGCAPRQWRTTTIPEPDPDNIPTDRVKRHFDQGRLDVVWVGDITYIRTWSGWLYLATVIDAHSRRVIGWALAQHMRASLVTDALAMAVVQRGYPVAGVIFHSDRGVQYTSTALKALARQHGLLLSVGRTGVCWDNAMAESFFATLKNELIYRHPWPTQARARAAVIGWIEGRYNRRRRHSAISMMTPVEFENTARHTAAQAA
ncbi:MAG TPA: IS3 family transposase [Frankiaceae bacterium]|nr:IS3 family transposase [Frankiaceae bacterium]